MPKNIEPRRVARHQNSGVAMRALLAAAAAIAAALSLSCSWETRYYSATLAGYVQSSKADSNGNYQGINGAEVAIYLEDPAANASATPSVKTSTMTSGNNNGYWSHKIMWSTTSPSFADKGDSGTVWVKVMRAGYFPKVAKISGILSDSSNVVTTVSLAPIRTTTLKGRVVNQNGAGVNGVNVVLDLMSTADTKSDYTATTATADGVVGVFSFSTIAWEDADSKPVSDKSISSDGATATESVKIYVDDTNYYSDTNSADERYKKYQTAFTITSDADVDVRDKPITIYGSSFSVPGISGLVKRVGSDGKLYEGLNKVTVALLFPVQGGNAQTTTTASGSAGDGTYAFTKTAATWTNNRPTHSDASDSSQGSKHDDVTAARIYVSDANYYSLNNADKPIEISVTSSDSDYASVPKVIPAGSAQFKASVAGKVNYGANAPSGTSVTGVGLSLAISGAQNALTAQSGSDGSFAFTNSSVSWTDNAPVLDQTTGALVSESHLASLYVSDSNYNSPNVQASPVSVTLSPDASISLSSPVYVTRKAFTCSKVTGSATAAGSPLVGVSVTLHNLDDPNATDVNATTDSSGNFSFSNVAWSDSEPTGYDSDSTNVKVYVNDTNYTAGAVTQSIGSGTSTVALSPALAVARSTGHSFSVTLTGTVKRTYTPTGSSTSTTTNLSGAQVSIAAYPTTDQSAANINCNANSSSPLIVQTDGNGQYTATITWALDPGYTPPSNAAANGGDILPLRVTVTPTDAGLSAMIVPDNSKDPYNLLSWSNNNIVNATYTN